MIKIRNARLGDAEKIYELEKRVWGKTGATLEMIESRLKIFPAGAYVASEGKQIVGVVFFEIINSKNKFKSWYDYTDNGKIAKSHDPKGDKIFGIDLSVSEDYSGNGIGTDLLMCVAEYSIRKGLKGGILGGRIPFYYKYQDMDVNDYVRYRDDNGKLVDPEIRFYKRAGLAIKDIIPNYFEDPFSKDYGVLLEWTNPFYKVKNKTGRLIGAWIFKFGFKINLALSK